MARATTTGPGTFGQEADFVIITALEKEAQAVIRRLEDCHIQRFEDRDIRTYHCGLVPIQEGDRAYRVVVVSLPSMGEIAAANAVTDAVTRWRPRFVLMVGIAGGIPQDDLDLGDVVVADQIVGYEYGKVTDKGIKPRDRVYPASQLLLDRVRSFWDESWTEQIDVDRPASAHRPTSKRFVGPVASGNKVIASTEFREQLKARWPKLIALEMEGEGVFAAVFDRPEIRHMLVIRGICDMADERKSDDWQEYAANAAAAYAIALLRGGPVEPSTPTAPATPEPVKISLAKLPSTSPDLFGRDDELATLGSAWENPDTNVLTFVAWGGVGKTALVNKWLLGMGEDDYRGARRVFGWSFYSQGAREDAQASADPFVDAALRWFGDPDPTAGSPWDRGERLAELVRREKTLLVLDGLEPLQYPPGEMGGRLKDPGLQCLLRGLAHHNPGLCILTTRLEVDDLKDFVGTSVVRIPLENLSPQAGAQVLRTQGAQGTDAELQQAAREFGGHALALTLLGSLLRDVYGGDVRCRSEVGPLEEELRQGGHARRVIASYERWLGEGPELAILRMLGLFDRPAKGDEIAALRAAPPIAGLTDALHGLSERGYRLALAKLRRARLLAERDPAQPDTLDAHPLVREHFAAQLQHDRPVAWREGNERLYEHLKATTKEYPDTLEEMMLLFAAVAHGCRAGRHQEALIEVYWQRALRGDEHFSWKKLGSFGADLAALSGFFDLPWRKPVDGLTEADKSFVLAQAGLYLRALGRLAEAAQPMQASLEAYIEQQKWAFAARLAGNLSELHLTLGDLAQAVDAARQSVELADRSEDTFWQMASRTILADALHQAGQLEDAAALFRESEEMQQEHQSQFPLLYSLPGYQYCDLLLGQGQAEEVQRRATQSIEVAQRNNWLLDIALDHLSLGRAHLMQAQSALSPIPSPARGRGARGEGDYEQAAAHLHRAVDGLRQAGYQEFIIRGLLARAALFRAQAQYDKAQHDLDEALSITQRGVMRLFEADCHLEYARLHLARRQRAQAQECLDKAKEMIKEMGYHRRDGQVAELEEAL